MKFHEIDEAPSNHEQKCLCVLVLDVSGSMSGEAMQQLNEGLQLFQQDVQDDIVAAKRLEVAIVTFGSRVECVQPPALMDDFIMPRLETQGTTRLVDGMRQAMQIIEERKGYYKRTGQQYYRPMMVLITDGEPDHDQDTAGLSNELATGIEKKNFMYYALGVKGYNHAKLSAICPSPPPLPLDGYKFSAFFKWLSNSISTITKSKEGETIKLAPIDAWAQIKI
jgi:uncharacterized protein YegL